MEKNSVAIILLYAHIKTRLFLFSINVFEGVDSESAIHFFRPALETPDNPEKTIFFRIIEVFRYRTKKIVLQHLFRQVKKPFSITSSIRKITANPEYHQLYCMPISPQ